MHAHVTFEVVRCVVARHAAGMCATVRLLPSVNQDVALQMVLTDIALAAADLRACVWSLARVGTHMLVQPAWFAVLLATAFKGTRVNRSMASVVVPAQV